MTRDELAAFRNLVQETVRHCDILLEESMWEPELLNHVFGPMTQHLDAMRSRLEPDSESVVSKRVAFVQKLRVR